MKHQDGGQRFIGTAESKDPSLIGVLPVVFPSLMYFQQAWILLSKQADEAVK